MAACQFVLPASAVHQLEGLQLQPETAAEHSKASSDDPQAITPTLPGADRPSTSLTYSSMHVDAKDPLSTLKPLRPFDRSTFESAFPPSTSSSVTSSPVRSFSAAFSTTPSSSTAGSPHPGNGDDPFFYPLLPENERRRLAEFWFLTAGIHDDASLAKHLQTLLTLVRDLYGFDIALLQFIDNDRSSSLTPDGWQGSCYPRRETGCAHTMLLEPGSVLNVDDFFDDARFAGNPQIVSAQMRSYAGVPLAYTISGSGESISLGSLCIMSVKEKKPPLTEAQRSSLARFANLAVSIIKDRMRLRREAIQTKRHEHLSILAKTTGPPSTVVQTTLETLEATLGGEASFVEAVNGSLELSNAGRVPVTAFTDDIWENGPVIEDFIKYHNHESSLEYNAGCTVRAMAIPLTNVNGHYILIQTGHLRDVFDGSDALFVRSCAMVISSSIQDGLLRQALEAKTSFLRNVQHAFRTSLNGILSATDLLLQQDPAHIEGALGSKIASPLAEELSVKNTSPLELLKIVETSGRGLLTVVNHLIDLDGQGIDQRVDICDLHDIEEEVLDMIVQQSSLEKIRDILLVSDSHLSGSTGDCIITNRLLLKQAVSALVRNAVEATSAGGMVTVKIRLEGEAGVDQSLVIDVQDTGCGIAEADQERIFLPFEKVSHFSQHSGLGLAFSSQYVITLGGTLRLLSSSPNQGSLFQICIPNPVLASSLEIQKKRKNLPRDWSYWMNPTAISRDMGDVYGRSLRNMGIAQAKSSAQATLLVQPMTSTMSKAETETPDFLQLNQLLLMLGWEDDHHRKLMGREAGNRTVYGRLPWTRHRLVETLSQAQKVLQLHMEGKKKETLSHAPNGQTFVVKYRDTLQMRALLVDDNAMNLNILQAYCKKRKYSFDSARDGQEAFEAYMKACKNGQPPNICLLDLQMPICDGLACAKLMRDYEKKEGLIRCPIIIVTAQSGDADRQSSFEAGSDAYHVQPLRISTLDDIVARYARA